MNLGEKMSQMKILYDFFRLRQIVHALLDMQA